MIPPDLYPATTKKNHVPVLAQLGVLSLLLVGAFGLLWYASPSDTPSATLTSTIATSTEPASSWSVEESRSVLSDVSLTAAAAYVWDVKGQRVLYEKNAEQALPLASITKLMTALLTHELVTERATIVPLAGVAQEGDSGLRAGEVLSQTALQHMALVASSNDAAYTLAATAGELLGEQDAAAQFVAAMNIRAHELGLQATQFQNMTGLDISATEPGAVGTAREVSELLAYIITHHPGVAAVTTEDTVTIYSEQGFRHDLSNTNQFTANMPNLLGSKTGYTDLAGGNLTIAFDAGYDRPIIVTVLGSTRADRFTDVLTLIDAVTSSVSATNTYE